MPDVHRFKSWISESESCICDSQKDLLVIVVSYNLSASQNHILKAIRVQLPKYFKKELKRVQWHHSSNLLVFLPKGS